MNVLVCDDSAFMRGVIKNFLIKEYGKDTKIDEVEDGEQALAVFRSSKPDLVLLDIIMPKKDGIGVLKEIGRMAAVIVVSAAGQDELIDEAKSLGARHFVSKPFDFKQLKETIDLVLKG